MVWDNLINMFLQPWVGLRSDRTHTRLGRRKPWLLVGAPLAAVFFIMVPFVRENFVLIALAILGTNLGMALFRSPTIAYLGDLFPAEQRSKANGVINLMGGLGGALALSCRRHALPHWCAPAVHRRRSRSAHRDRRGGLEGEGAPGRREQYAGKEPGLAENIRTVVRNADRSGLYLLAAIFAWFVAWNAIETFFTLYARNVLGIEPGSAARMLTLFAAMLIVFAIPSGLIATRIGRRPTIMIGLVGMLAGLAVCAFVRVPQMLMLVLLLMGGFWALVNINSLPMVYDLGEQRSVGAYTGLYYFSSSAAAIAGPILAGRLIDLTSYQTYWPFCLVFMALAIVLMPRCGRDVRREA